MKFPMLLPKQTSNKNQKSSFKNNPPF